MCEEEKEFLGMKKIVASVFTYVLFTSINNFPLFLTPLGEMENFSFIILNFFIYIPFF